METVVQAKQLSTLCIAMSLALSRSCVLHCFERDKAIEIHNEIMLDLYSLL